MPVSIIQGFPRSLTARIESFRVFHGELHPAGGPPAGRLTTISTDHQTTWQERNSPQVRPRCRLSSEAALRAAAVVPALTILHAQENAPDGHRVLYEGDYMLNLFLSNTTPKRPKDKRINEDGSGTGSKYAASEL